MVAEHLRRLPFDLFGRYSLAARLVEHLHPDGGAAVLDVGGAPVAAIADFLPDHDVVTSDLQVPARWHQPAPDLIVADGAELPFADDAFDVVLCLDTLEHVPEARRADLLHEVRRVSRGWVLVGSPCTTPGVAEADAALLAFVRARFGEDFETVRTLTEHLAFGYPDPDDVEAALRAGGAAVARFPNGRLDRWLPMMVLFFDLLALGRDDPVERVQSWYNHLLADDDQRDPAYRQMFLTRLPDAPGPPVEAVRAALVPHSPPRAPGAAAFEALREVLTTSLTDAVAEERARADGLAAELEQVREALEHQTGRADAAEIHVRSLLHFRDRVINHPAMKVRRGIRRTLGSE